MNTKQNKDMKAEQNLHNMNANRTEGLEASLAEASNSLRVSEQCTREAVEQLDHERAQFQLALQEQRESRLDLERSAEDVPSSRNENRKEPKKYSWNVLESRPSEDSKILSVQKTKKSWRVSLKSCRIKTAPRGC
ncbi:hypothetical protein H257_12097 [Aphanomyces astaci]|uniref:Uncharacterized protein n=1 Tax=Aphanomyces astaci TaxID=112090 RepID=W4G1C5_APHAT|nr:hypothetical protein H257_12097 [Aphanomyces astaci]ETV73061.1 hypothetical protein H257_12097 [Aphanomyces astaci]|eukprot:XP_009837510.1 hypothetical protein H257_12097 [Aphanomyces astaci]